MWRLSEQAFKNDCMGLASEVSFSSCSFFTMDGRGFRKGVFSFGKRENRRLKI